MIEDFSLGFSALSRPCTRFRPVVETLGQRIVPALVVTKTVDDSIVKVGERVKFIIEVENTGSNAITSAEASDGLPRGLRPIRAIGRGSRIEGQNVFFNLGTLQPGQSVTLTVIALAERQGRFRNSAAATGLEGGQEFVIDNDSSRVRVTRPNPPMPPVPPVNRRIPMNSGDSVLD